MKTKPVFDGVGIDCVEIKRFKSMARKALQKIFTTKELAYCVSRLNPAQHLAGKFAAKEAVIKAFGSGKKLGLAEIEIINDQRGMPIAIIGSGKRKCLVSISHAGNMAIAVAFAGGSVDA